MAVYAFSGSIMGRKRLILCRLHSRIVPKIAEGGGGVCISLGNRPECFGSSPNSFSLMLHFHYAPRTGNYMKTDFEKRLNGMRALGQCPGEWGLTKRGVNREVRDLSRLHSRG